MAYHALLDWRLARDLFGILRGRGLSTNNSQEAKILRQWATSYHAIMLDHLPAPAAVFEHPLRGKYIVISRHPLEAAEHDRIAPRLAKAYALATTEVDGADGTVFVDTFTLDRDPRKTIALFDEIASQWTQ